MNATPNTIILPAHVDTMDEVKATALVGQISLLVDIPLGIERVESRFRGTIWHVFQLDAAGNVIALRGSAADLSAAITLAFAPGRNVVVAAN